LDACSREGRRGTARARFTVGREGRVVSATLDASFIQDTKTRDCIVQVLMSLVFPPPEGGGPVTITYPLVISG